MSAPRAIPDAARARQTRASDPGVLGLRVGQCRLRQDPCAGAARDPAAARRRDAGEDPLHHLHQGRRRQHGEARVHHARPLGHARRRRRSTQAIRDAGIANPDAKLRMRARELFACALETPGGLKVQTIHALLHAAAAAVSVRGQCRRALRRARRARPERNDGARQPRGAAARPPREPDSADRPRAGDRHGECRRRHASRTWCARRCLSRDQFTGLDRRAGERRSAPSRSSRAALGVEPDDHSENVEREIVDGPNLPRSRMGGGRRRFSKPAARPTKSQAAQLREALALSGSGAGR